MLHHLNPKPGLKFADAGTQYVVPDIIVERTDDGDYDIRLIDDWVPNIRISKRYRRAVQGQGPRPEGARSTCSKKLQSADWLVEGRRAAAQHAG